MENKQTPNSPAWTSLFGYKMQRWTGATQTAGFLNQQSSMDIKSRTTLPETNIAPENRPSQKETSIPTIHF